MKARLKSTQQEEVTRLSDMEEGQFAVIVGNSEGSGNILFKANPYTYVDLTGNLNESHDSEYNPQVRILKAGELIEIVE